MPRKPRKNYSFSVPIFNDTYSVIVCWGDTKYIGKTMLDNNYPQEDVDGLNDLAARSGGLCYTREMCHPLIALPGPPTTPQAIGTLAHEACHAIEFIFEIIDQPFGNEVFAHSVGAIVRVSMEYANGKR